MCAPEQMVPTVEEFPSFPVSQGDFFVHEAIRGKGTPIRPPTSNLTSFLKEREYRFLQIHLKSFN